MDTKLKARADELDVEALHNHPMPEGLTQPLQLYFQTMRLIYRRFKQGDMGEQQAKAEKRAAREALDDAEFNRRGYEYYTKISRTFQHEIHKDGLPCASKECRLWDIICGMDKELI
jgi:hypothetical protein